MQHPIRDILKKYHASTEDHEKDKIILSLLDELYTSNEIPDFAFRVTQEIIKLDHGVGINSQIIKKIVSILFCEDKNVHVMYPADILLALDRETVFSCIKEHEEQHGPSKNIRSQATVRFVKTMFGDGSAIDETIYTFSKLLDKDKYQIDIWYALISLSHYKSVDIMDLFDRAMNTKNIIHTLGKEPVKFRHYIAHQDIDHKVVNTMKKYFILPYSDSGTKCFVPRVYFPFEFRNYPGWGDIKAIQKMYFIDIKSKHNKKLEESIRESALSYWGLWGQDISLQELFYIWIENPQIVRGPLGVY